MVREQSRFLNGQKKHTFRQQRYVDGKLLPTKMIVVWDC